MNYRRFLHGAKFWFWVALFVAYSAGAVGLVMIDTYDDRYRQLSKVTLTSVKAQEDVRRAGASQVAAVYRGPRIDRRPAFARFRGTGLSPTIQ